LKKIKSTKRRKGKMENAELSTGKKKVVGAAGGGGREPSKAQHVRQLD